MLAYLPLRPFLTRLLALAVLGLCLTAEAYSQSTAEISEAEQYRGIVQAIGNKNYEHAIELGRRLIKRTDNYEQVYSRIVEAAHLSGRLEWAEEVFESLLELAPANPRGYYGLGLVCAKRQNYPAAIEYFKKCLTAQPGFHPPLLALIDAYYAAGDPAGGQAYLEALTRSRPDDPLGHLGLGYWHSKGDRVAPAVKEFDLALSLNAKQPVACYQKALALLNAGQRMDSLDAIAGCFPAIQDGLNEEYQQAFLNLRATGHLELMNFSEAVNLLHQALDFARKMGDRMYEEASLAYLALADELQGKYSQALSGWKQAYALAKESKSPSSAINLRRYPGWIGNIYYWLGDTAQALGQFQAGLELTERDNDEEMQVIYLSRISDVLIGLNDPGKTAVYKRLLETKAKSSNPLFQVQMYDLLSTLSLRLGENQKARELLRRTLDLSRELPDFERELHALNHFGELYFQTSDYPSAMESYREAFRLAQERNNPLQAWTASAGLAATCRRLGQPAQAREYYQQAIRLMEDVRARLTIEEERAGFFSDKVKLYKDLIEVLIELHGEDGTKGYEREAFDYAERARGRAFLDLLAEGKVNLEQTLAPDLLEQRQRIAGNISRLNAELMKERSVEPAKQNKVAIERLEKARGEADYEYANWLRELRRRDPQYAALKYPEPVSLAQTQQLLDERTVLLAYSVGESASYLFAVSRDVFLPIRLRGTAAEIRRDVEQLVSAITGRSATKIRVLSVGLYEQLIQPAGELIKGKSELIVVADGALHRLPFEVLLPPSSRQITQPGTRSLPFLVRNYAISYAPSASVLAGLRDYHRTAEAGQKAFLAFGDPVYDAEAQRENGAVATAMRGARGDDGQWTFRRLVHSRREVTGIAALFPAGQADVLLGAQATEENAKTAGRLGRYRIIHFAAHGLINQTKPRFSGIVLSLPDLSKPEPQAAAEDGILQAYELFNLKLNADLVVLSACETGLGKEVNGEGIMGLVRAFIYAGTSSVMVSLWNVDDEKSADLMIRFYAHLKTGKSKSEALRQAQIEMIQKNLAPYFWAPFILTGNAH